MMRKLLLSAASLTTIVSSMTCMPAPAVAEDKGAVLTSEGISGDVDKKRRGPVVTVGTQYFAAGNGAEAHARILVDAYIPNEDYQKYPIRVEFYVNRNLFTSQIRSTELPGPLGIDVPASKATVPFNYSIVATLLHPNREFTTVIHGAVFENNLNSTTGKSCSLTVTSVQTGDGNSNEAKTYVAKDVQIGQLGNNTVSVEFDSSELDDGSGAATISAASSLTINGDKATGTVTTTVDGRSQSVAVEGTATVGDSGVETFSVESADKFTSLSCE
jgi:hypothetical protein